MLLRKVLCHRGVQSLKICRSKTDIHRSLPTVFKQITCQYSAGVKPTVPPVPGSVKPYNWHIFIQTGPELSPKSSKSDVAAGCWWPPVVEKEPAIVQAFSAVAKNKTQIDGTVRITAYEENGKNSATDLGKSTCDLLLFPAGVEYRALPLSKVSQVVECHLVAGKVLPEELEDLSFDMKGLHLFVCCHGSRDARCGSLGPPLVRRLATLAREEGLEGAVKVYKCSHIGGHKYAGNVLVYGAVSPCDMDWFGGINASNAAEFFKALINAEMGSEGGPEDPVLRKWWRGRGGLTEEEQLELYESRSNIQNYWPESGDDEESSDSDSDGSSSASSEDKEEVPQSGQQCSACEGHQR